MTLAESHFIRESSKSVDYLNFDFGYTFRRSVFIPTYGFACLTEEAIKAMSHYGPIVEVGSGGGYWAYEMLKAGIDVIPTDIAPIGSVVKNEWEFNVPWTSVRRMSGVEAVKAYPSKTLLLCWPYMADWAVNTLLEFTGTYVISVDEGRYGCCATDDYFDVLDEFYEMVQHIRIPTFPTIHDSIKIWRRK